MQRHQHNIIKDNKLLERVQHRFSGMVPKLKKLTCEQRLNIWDCGKE